jgi:hypothetical protein
MRKPTKREIADAKRVAAGLPSRRCLECGGVGPHWVADRLNVHGDLVPGYFTCAPAVDEVGAQMSRLVFDV